MMITSEITITTIITTTLNTTVITDVTTAATSTFSICRRIPLEMFFELNYEMPYVLLDRTLWAAEFDNILSCGTASMRRPDLSRSRRGDPNPNYSQTYARLPRSHAPCSSAADPGQPAFAPPSIHPISLAPTHPCSPAHHHQIPAF